MDATRAHWTSSTCDCFGRVAVRIGLVTREQLLACDGFPVEEALIERGYLTQKLAARVRETLRAAGCKKHGRRGAA